MPVIIRIPSSLRNLADARDNFLTEASTVGEALDCLLKDYPDLKPHLEDERGSLPPFINVFLNEEDIRFLDGKASQCQQGDEISIVAAIAGG